MDIMRFVPSLTIGMPKNDGETDDAIGTFVHDVAPKPCFVCTNDRDMWSLISDHTRLFKKPAVEFTRDDLASEFGITNPWKIALAKALLGDKSDNIKPTVPGTPKELVTPVLETCRMFKGEKQYAPAFFRALEELRGSRKIDSLFASREQIAFAERWIRLRRVELSYRFGQRNPVEFKKRLDWYRIVKKAPKLVEFAAN
jgi:5'-3' exonuclease